MKYLLITSIIILYSTTAVCQSGYRQRLNSVAAIVFPDTPKARHFADSSTLYVIPNKEDIYVAEVRVLKRSAKNDYKDIYQAGIQALELKGGKLLYKKDVNLNGLRGVEYCFTVGFRPINYYKYERMFYFNETLIMYGFWSADSLRGQKSSKSFFDTFKLTVKKTDIRQSNPWEWMPGVGKTVGVLVALFSIFLIGLALVFILKKIIYNNNG